MSDQEPQKWERDLLSRIAMAGVNEQRRARRWRIFMWMLTLLYLTVLILVSSGAWQFSGKSNPIKGEHVAVVQVNGIIAPDSDASADMLVPAMRDAMENENAKALLLRINSPGGSPVQSELVYSEILRLRSEYPEKPVYAVIEDIGASGAYYIASAAENIYAIESSIVGSIGVTSGGSFGFVKALEKLGVERRIYTSGENKAFLDPFLPEKQQDIERYESMLNSVHQQFIKAVTDERGERLKDDGELFSGYVWTGEESLELGLIDGFGDMRGIAREMFETDEIVDYTRQADFLTRFAENLGASAANTLIEAANPAPEFR
ncbi:peptidase S49 [gamma proteobacterium HTCC5015]|nr:peptidase S49 [gamma proteobacterium HTCC5015]